jgi:hypothetical protein
MRKASTELLEQGTQTPSPAPDLIPAETEHQPRTHIGIGTANGGTSELSRPRPKSGYGVRQAHLKVSSSGIASSLVAGSRIRSDAGGGNPLVRVSQ